MKEFGIVDSGDAETLGIGAITDEKVEDFFNKMVEAGVIEADIDWKASYTTDFVDQGVGMDLKN
jgi:NitT/TauT family transport system substrate-binding protein